MDTRNAFAKINKRGALLVFPINNRKLPLSLWSEFFPRLKMRWEWDESGDNRVGSMWHLMKKLSDGRKVVYSKWYQGRATFFSREVFTAMLALVREHGGDRTEGLSFKAREVLELLEGDSPLSTKQIKAAVDLQGKLNEPAYNRAMKELFGRLLIVAYGEVDDGAFPSLAVGATRLLFEDLWLEAGKMRPEIAEAVLDRFLPEGNHFRKYFTKSLLKAAGAAETTVGS
jgi:hypothetical protein